MVRTRGPTHVNDWVCRARCRRQLSTDAGGRASSAASTASIARHSNWPVRGVGGRQVREAGVPQPVQAHHLAVGRNRVREPVAATAAARSRRLLAGVRCTPGRSGARGGHSAAASSRPFRDGQRRPEVVVRRRANQGLSASDALRCPTALLSPRPAQGSSRRRIVVQRRASPGCFSISTLVPQDRLPPEPSAGTPLRPACPLPIEIRGVSLGEHLDPQIAQPRPTVDDAGPSRRPFRRLIRGSAGLSAEVVGRGIASTADVPASADAAA